MKLNKRNLAITLTAIVAIAGVTIYTVHLGHDFNTALIAIAFIGGLAGFTVAKG